MASGTVSENVSKGVEKMLGWVSQSLLRSGESVRVLTRNKKARLPDGVEVAVGDLLDFPTRSVRDWTA
jgi:hypothetical protein